MASGGSNSFSGRGIPSDLRRSAVRGGIAMVLSRGVVQVLRLTLTAVLARILSPDDFGLVAIVLAVIGLAALFQDMGLSGATVQRAEITEQQISSLFWINSGMGLLACIVTASCAGLIADFYARPELGAIAAALSLAFLFSGLTVQHNALLYRRMQFSLRAKISLIALAVSGPVAVAMAYAGFGPWALVVQTLLGDVVTLVLVWGATRFRPASFQWNREVREMIGFGGQLLTFRVLGYVAQNLQVILLGRNLGAATAALYTRANVLSVQLLGYANDTAGQIANSALPRLVKEPQRYVRFYLHALAVVCFATAPISLFLGFFSADVILFLFGPNWSQSAEVLSILAIGMAVQPLLNSTGWVFFSQGEMHRMLRWGFFGWSVVIVASLIGLRWGLIGIAWGWTIGMVLLVPLGVLYAFRRHQISLRACLRVLLPPLLAAAIAAIAAFELTRGLGDLSVFLRLPLEGTIFSIIYLLLAWSLFGQKVLIMEVLNALKRRQSTAGANGLQP